MLRQFRITTVYVTHDQEEAMALCDQVVVMGDGRIEQIGTPFEIYNFPSDAVRGAVRGHAQPRQRRRGRRSAAAASPSPDSSSAPPRPSREAHSGDHVTLAVRPEGIDLGEGEEGRTGSAGPSRTSTSSGRSCGFGWPR